jgi:hypothetical protein
MGDLTTSTFFYRVSLFPLFFTLYSLPLTGLDVILGVQWLEQLDRLFVIGRIL